MQADDFSIQQRTYRLPFYASHGTFEQLNNDWINNGPLPLVQHDTEGTFWLQIRYQKPPVVLVATDTALLESRLIARVAETEQRPLIVSIIESTAESLLTECYLQGADRVVAIPHCSPRILQALIRAMLPRHNASFPPYRISNKTQTVNCAGHDIRLTKKAFDVAQYLFTNNNQLIPKSTILEDVWGIYSERCQTRRVETQISHLRNRLLLDGSHGWEIRMRRGKGYGIFNMASRTDQQYSL